MNNKELFYKLLEIASKEKYPDIHLTTWNLPIMRNHSWELFKLEEIDDDMSSWDEVVGDGV